MARRPRSVLPASGIYHVTARGVDRCAIYRDDLDRAAFVVLLRAVARRRNWTVPVYCLMGNHYHLIVETTLESLSAGVHRLNGTHAQSFNDRHSRVGHLFQGRFDSRVIRDDEHLSGAIEYTRNNPVRARLVETPDQWPWSGRIR